MADQPNMFEGGETPPPKVEPTQVDKVADLLKSIKNESGEPKYDTLEKALEALGHSQQYIPQVKSQLSESEKEIARLKAELEQRESIEDVVKRLAASGNPNGEGHPPAATGLDEQAVMKLVQATLNQSKQVETVQSNRQRVESALAEHFGGAEKAAAVITEKAALLGKTPQQLGELAGTDPQLVLELFKVQGVRTPNPTVRGNNIEALPRVTDRVKPPEKSLMAGASNKEIKDYWLTIKEQVHKDRGITN